MWHGAAVVEPALIRALRGDYTPAKQELLTAPDSVRLVGGSAASALAATRRMYEIALAEHPLFAVPALEFRGTPAGIDVTLVARTRILPQINSGMAGKVAGTGQVGAGLVTPPAEVFPAALRELAARAER